MKKQEALDVMHEILALLQESVIIESVSLDKRCARVFEDTENGNGHFSIRMRCILDSSSADRLKPIMNKRGLVMCQDNGFVVISKNHT
jgi:hypothetical protein